tara:strand:- start:1438 stop:2319 length:882 start_codon:yes stop_codon:yes gene_type:complete
MAMLGLILDLKKIYDWKINVWHGDHGWHEKSADYLSDLRDWCIERSISFYSSVTNKSNIHNEESAREWRYKNLIETVELINKKNKKKQCKRIVTGHTSSDKAETFIINLARGTNIAGLGSIKAIRTIKADLKLVRPLISFKRDETSAICKMLNIPIWPDPTNNDISLTRNKVRKIILPSLEELYPGSSLRITSLAQNFGQLDQEREAITKLAILFLQKEQGLSRNEFIKLPKIAQATVLSQWIVTVGGPQLSAGELKKATLRLEKGKPPGCQQLKKGWQICWGKDLISIKQKT